MIAKGRQIGAPFYLEDPANSRIFRGPQLPKTSWTRCKKYRQNFLQPVEGDFRARLAPKTPCTRCKKYCLNFLHRVERDFGAPLPPKNRDISYRTSNANSDNPRGLDLRPRRGGAFPIDKPWQVD